MQYLVTDIRDLSLEAETPRQALIIRENQWRAQPLPASSKASVYSEGNMLDISLGESAIHGLKANVTRL